MLGKSTPVGMDTYRKNAGVGREPDLIEARERKALNKNSNWQYRVSLQNETDVIFWWGAIAMEMAKKWARQSVIVVHCGVCDPCVAGV